MGFTKLFGVRQNMISDKGEGGVNQFLIFSDKGGGGVSQFLIFGWQGGEGGLDPTFLADIICEQHISSKIGMLKLVFEIQILLQLIVKFCIIVLLYSTLCWHVLNTKIFTRPGVAGAVLQSPPSIN